VFVALLDADVGRMNAVEVVALELETELAHYPFGAKVLACAQAEELVPRGTKSLAWLGAGSLLPTHVRPT